MRSVLNTTVLFSGASQVLPACLAFAGQMRLRGLVPDTLVTGLFLAFSLPFLLGQ